MNPQNIYNTQIKELLNESLMPFKGLDSCEVSKASVEIMLERFYNGKEVDFPFAK